MNDNFSPALMTANSPRSITDISASLNFIHRQEIKPVFHSAALTGGEMKFLFDPEAHTVAISDMREIAETLSVDREGFELLRHTTAVEDLYADNAIEQVYKPEIVALLRHRFGASQVVIFDVTRRSDGAAGAQNPTACVVRRAGFMSTTPSKADRSAQRIFSARTKWPVLLQSAPGSSR